jgi:transposase
MPNKPIDMHKLRLLLRLYFQEISGRQAAYLTGLSRNTVRHYWSRIKEIDWSEERWDGLSDLELNRLLISSKLGESNDPRYLILKALLPTIAKELRRPRMTIARQWEHYRKHHPDGFGRTAFTKYVQRYRQRHTGYMVQRYTGLPTFV